MDASEDVSEKEVSAATRFVRILDAIDLPRCKRDDAPPVILIEIFGPGKTMKSTLAIKLRQFFGRYGARVMLPPEGAELEDVRGFSEEDPMAFQELHIAHVLKNVLGLSESRIFHVAVIDRGLVDMRAWLLGWVRKGLMRESDRSRYDDFLLGSAALRRMSACYHVTCNPATSLTREHQGSVTRRRGKKMNEKNLTLMHEVWRASHGFNRHERRWS